MKKIKFIALVTFTLAFLGCVSTKNSEPAQENSEPEYTAEDYYILGCNALDEKEYSEAENYFLKGIECSWDSIMASKRQVQGPMADSVIIMAGMTFKYGSTYFGSVSFDRDLKYVKANSNISNWQIYYYKGILEGNVYYDYSRSNLFVLGTILDKKELAIESLQKSISLFDNYPAHIVLSFLLEDSEKALIERDKAAVLAEAIGDKNVSRDIYLSQARTFEYEENFEKALIYYKNAELTDSVERIEAIINILPKVKEEGFASYAEYEKYEKQERERQSWNNLLTFLSVGKVKTSIPLKKGDIIEIPDHSIVLIDAIANNYGYIYLFSANGYNKLSKCCYIVTKKQIPTYRNTVIQTLTLRCEGIDSYTEQFMTEECYVFTIVEE